MRLGEMATWRYICEDNVTASFGLAGDECLMEGYHQGAALRSPSLRLYTYKSHCILVGRFQNVAAEVNPRGLQSLNRLSPQLTWCFGGRLPQVETAALPGASRAHQEEVVINRRLTGGGTILMGEGQLGLALVTSLHYPGAPAHPQEALESYSRGIVEGLRSLGIDARLRSRNDIEVGGRKIAGLGVYIDEQDTLLFHASILVDFDVRLMLTLLHTPLEKIADKNIASVEERITTVRRETGKAVSTAAVREKIKEGFQKVFAVELVPQPFTAEERRRIRELEEGKYLREEWIYQRSPTPDMMGSSSRKTRAGLLTVYVALAGEVIKSVLISGDFFSAEATISELEAKLKWRGADKGEIERVVMEQLSGARNIILNLAPEVLVELIWEAITAAREKATV
jgi:lipoate-protein ligase A